MTLPAKPSPTSTSRDQAIDLVKVKSFLIGSLNKVMDDSGKVSPEQRQRIAYQNLEQIYSRTGLQLAQEVREKLFQQVLDELSGYGPIQPLLDNQDITEVMVNRPKHIYIEQSG